MKSLDEQWEWAYARQARSDYAVYKTLTRDSAIAQCQSLHYLQMFLEKIAKCHYSNERQRLQRPGDYLKSHSVISKAFAGIYKHYCDDLQITYKQVRLFLPGIRDLCGSIERLAPAVDAESFPQNCEYPWIVSARESGDRVVSPLDEQFAVTWRLQRPEGKRLFKCALWKLEQIERRFGAAS